MGILSNILQALSSQTKPKSLYPGLYSDALKRYKIKAKYKPTGRTRTFELQTTADLETEVSPDYERPLEVEILPSIPPTDPQISLAKKHRIPIPNDATICDLTALISNQLDYGGSQPQNCDLLRYALRHNLCESSYACKWQLFNRIFNKLKGKDRIAFFALCIYRYCSDDLRADLDNHPHRLIFYAIAEHLSDDPKFAKSFEHYKGTPAFFGELRVENQNSIETAYDGGSTRAYAFEAAWKMLHDELGIKKRTTKVINSFADL